MFKCILNNLFWPLLKANATVLHHTQNTVILSFDNKNCYLYSTWNFNLCSWRAEGRGYFYHSLHRDSVKTRFGAHKYKLHLKLYYLQTHGSLYYIKNPFHIYIFIKFFTKSFYQIQAKIILYKHTGSQGTRSSLDKQH